MSKILIAEDNSVNRELLRELLEARGYTVVEACDGQQALHMIEQTQPDLLLLDIGMPVMDGFGVMRKIRENPRLATLPVLAVTAYAMQGDREKILNSGFNGYLSKPVNARSLAQELDRLLIKQEGRSTSPDQSHENLLDIKARAAGKGK
ncbi:MAG TPA: response regulator [Terriglobales bacterium]|nr:response regulator [Terriglobales bacterium]